MQRPALLKLLICFICLLHTGCSNTYHNSKQGTQYATQNWDSVRIGMSKKQVAETLGKGHQHPFNDNIWIYTHLVNGQVNDRVSVLHFKNNILTRIEIQQDHTKK